MSEENKELREKILRLEGRVDELSRQICELQKDSHKMHLMPCKYDKPNDNSGWGPLWRIS